MQLALPEDSLMIREMFEKFFAAESTPARVRAAEPVGFDPALWAELVGIEAPFLRVDAAAGGGGMSLFDASLMMEEAGRRLASAPLAEAVCALRALGEVGGEVARGWLAAARDGEAVVTLALRPARSGEVQLVPGAATANGILTFDGFCLAMERPRAPLPTPATLGGVGLALFEPGQGERQILLRGAAAGKIWSAAVEEWKVLTSAALIGLAQEALSLAAAYATERVAFGQPIGANQALAHPMADDVIAADGARMLLWLTLRRLADGHPAAAAGVSGLFWWCARMASACVAHALHVFGGYGLTNEYDLQLYHRRAKALALPLGDPEDALLQAGRRRYLGEATTLPDASATPIDFEPPTGGEALAAETRAVFARVIDPERHLLGDQSFEAHDWGVHKALGAEGLLFPEWPKAWGGRGADADSTRASGAVWHEVGYTSTPRGVAGLIGAAVLKFGSPELQQEVLPRLAAGEALAALGYTEPSCGSDVFAAKTRAVRDGDEWVINGQKMFTSGAELASYVFLITRTDPDAPKHKGITVFLVPLDSPGIEIHPVYTFMDERTNATFYADVRIPDRYRLGEVNGGTRVMALALSMEQGGVSYHHTIREMAEAAVAWLERRGAIEDPRTLSRLARAHVQADIGEALLARVLATRLSGAPDLAYGPASKVFSTEAFIAASADLLDLTAPHSLLRGVEGLGLIEKGYRHSAATTIYGGTSEVLRSMVAERRLGLPRSRV